MNPITFPLKLRMKRPEVGDLQDALQQCLERSAILGEDEEARKELSDALKRERTTQQFGRTTRRLVIIFQEEQQLEQSGEVDKPTAKVLNALLREWGLLAQEIKPRFNIVTGVVRREDGLPEQGVRIRAVHEVERRSIRLGEDTTDNEGQYTIRYELLPEVKSINLRIIAIAINGKHIKSSDLIRNAKAMESIDLITPIADKPNEQWQLTGTILLEHGLPAEKIKLRLYRHDFGGKSTKLGETITLAGGQYAFSFDPGGKAASLEVRAVKGSKEIPLSKTLDDLGGESSTVLNLLAPGDLQPLAAEYQRLATDLTPHVGQIKKLADAKENSKRQDLTVLNRATGWDARLIALAATTERLRVDADVKLSSEALYGLLRAGLPSDKLMLARVNPDVAEKALKKMCDAGIVELTDRQIGQFKEQFTSFSTKVRLAIPAPGSHSTYGDLLKASGLDGGAQAKFAQIYLNHSGDAAKLWKSAREEGLDNEQIGKLQKQGKFAFLAGNSEAMTNRLMQQPINNPAELVDQDLHRVDLWLNQIFDLAKIPKNRWNNLTDADKKILDTVIPAGYAGEEIEDRLDAYADDMARKVRLSYPTHVVGRLLETNEIKLPDSHDATVTLLKSAAQDGFRLGETPVATFLKTHAGVRAGMSDTEFAAAQQQMKTLQRVYQITPGNEAMPVLMNMGMSSAYDVMAYSETKFTELFEANYLEIYKEPAIWTLAGLIYRKAKQVSSVTYNLFTIAKKLDSEPPVAGLSAPVEVRDSVRNELIKQFPTMESLFGSMDFCECEHCRSVLSPAAYLVDLLQFVDAEPGVWGNFLAHWKATHNNQEYPHKDKNGKAMKPYDVLIERRPDLPHIALTCENTHTALPYIDIVNEILEYYVANGKLEEEAAHDTGDASTEELLAEPQNVISEAYDKLRESRYPLNLPFDLWIETTRRFCNYFETPLDQVLETFRPSDELFVPAQKYDRFSIFMESLGLSPAEAGIFTNTDPFSKWYELYGYTSDAEARTKATDAKTGQRIDLNSAKALARRLDVTYKEITQIVQTGFVNPELTKLSVLYKLGVSIHDARFYSDHKALLGQDPSTLSSKDQKSQQEVEAFLKALEKHAEAFKVTTAHLEAELQAISFDEVLVLADPDAGCNFDLTTLQYADTTKAKSIDFLRINLLVRLWRKLDWSIEETDRALTTFMPQSVPFDENPANLAKQPLKTALIYLAHLKTLDGKVRVGKQSRLKLLALWSDIATTGKKPLYAQLFLTRSVLKTAPVFDDSLGRYLTKPGIKLKKYVLTLQGALGLTADEIRRILEATPTPLDTADLRLPNVSLLYRYGLMAKTMKLSVRELIALKQLSGFDPFKPLHPDPLTTIEEDYPFSQTLRFIEIADEVRESGLKIDDLEYLLRHRFDETGKYRPDRETTLALVKTLAEGVRTIRAKHAVPDDPDLLSDEVLRQKLGLALPSDVTERFLAMMNGTVEFSATKSGVDKENKLKPATFADEERIRNLNYKEVPHKEQKLTLRGVLFDDQKTELQTKFNADLTAAQQTVFAELLGYARDKAKAFFEKYLQKQAPNVKPASGFLEAADFDLLFKPMPSGLTKTQQQERVRQQQTRLAQAFLPFLQQRLIRQFIVQTMTAHTGAEPVLVKSLLTDKGLLASPKPLLDMFTAAGELGITAKFFAAADCADCTGAVLATVSLTDANTGLKDKDGNPLKPNGAKSACLEGYLEVQVPGAYRFYVALDKQAAEAELHFDHLPDPLFWKGAAPVDNTVLGDLPKEYLELKPGIPYRFTLYLRKLNGGEARMLVQGETLPKDRLSQLTLYPLTAMAGAERAVLLLTKILLLIQGLGINEREIRYLTSHATEFDDLNLNQLPTATSDDTPAGAKALFKQFLRLAGYSRLKRDLAGDTSDLIEIFEANGTDDLQKVYPLIANLTRRDKATIKESAEALFAAPAFASEKPLQRLWEVLQIVERFGVPVTSLLDWTRIVSPTATADQRFEIARDLKDAIKARFEPETWHRVAQPIFDKLRQRQRDALVSHVMQQHDFDRMEQLYEYFLIDPGMEPVVQTSRIRLAIASLQLFIQRSLLNLEKKVHPSVINSNHWQWMKRYRVWEANRKIFLFPENWLEPEFRDDKTHLFAELEGALLQGDVSSDLVEDAFLNYLRKLDELARLDIVAMHIEDDPDPARRILHVFGRTYSQPHKYFYRRYAQQMWTPWEPVSAEIEGDHLAPVIWRDRLYLFWVTFMDKPMENQKPTGTNANEKLTKLNLGETVGAIQSMVKYKKVEIQLHWSEYLQGEWSTRESSGFSAVLSNTVSMSFKASSVFVHVSKSYEAGEERGVYVTLHGAIKQSFYLAGRNSVPEKASYKFKPANPYNANSVGATRYHSEDSLTVTFKQRITTEGNQTQEVNNPLTILEEGNPYSLLPCNNNITMGGPDSGSLDADNPEAVADAIEAGLPEIASLIKPVFYQNNTDTLFVEPNVTEQTIEEWEEWITIAPQPEPGWAIPGKWPGVAVIPEIPWKPPFPDPGDPWRVPIDPGSLINPGPKFDWLVNPLTGLCFDDAVIGPSGPMGTTVLPSHEVKGAMSKDDILVNIHGSSDLARGMVALIPHAVVDQAGLSQVAGGLNVVGGAGFNSELGQNFNELNRSRVGTGK